MNTGPGLVLSRLSLSSLFLLSFRSSSVGLETSEWCRCRSLSFTPPASLRSHGSRPRPTRHRDFFHKTVLTPNFWMVVYLIVHLRESTFLCFDVKGSVSKLVFWCKFLRHLKRAIQIGWQHETVSWHALDRENKRHRLLFSLDVALKSFIINNTDVWFKISSLLLFTAPHTILIFVQYLSKGIQECYVTEEVIVSVVGQLREVSERFFTC